MKENNKGQVILRINEMIDAMPKGSKRNGVSTFISDFNRTYRLVDMTKLHAQPNLNVDLYASLRYQLYLVKLIRNEYKEKIGNLALHHDPQLISYLKNYVFTKIKILEAKIKEHKKIALKLRNNNNA